jgi:hypothetical protein
VTATDFANSYLTFFVHRGENIARIQLDAACTLYDDAAGPPVTYYLIAPCRAERMYRDDALFQTPNYEFCGIFTADECLLLRTHWVSARDDREYGRNRERFEDARLDVRAFAAAETLADRAAIVAATLANRPLVARTELRDAASGRRAVLEYPVKTMNVTREPARFQVDTGPLLLPDFASAAARPIERLAVAHVVYHTFDRAEFIVRAPTTAPGAAPATAHTDYSAVRALPARNEIVGCGA